jgi:hypothetical protein
MSCTISANNGTCYSTLTTPTTFIEDDWYISYPYYVVTCASSIPAPLAMSGPAWERWFDVWREPVKYTAPPRQEMCRHMRRAPARQCIKDARRWKRRRFVQNLAEAP